MPDAQWLCNINSDDNDGDGDADDNDNEGDGGNSDDDAGCIHTPSGYGQIYILYELPFIYGPVWRSINKLPD